MRRCLESLRLLRYPKSSVLVIENDSASGESEGIALSYGAGYRLCTQRGLSAARNLGVRISSSEILAFIDDDAVCEPDWLSTAIPLFGSEQVLAVAGKIVFHEGGARASAADQVFDPGDRNVGRETPDWFGMTNFGALALGSNLLVRRVAFELLGGFDERLGRGTSINCWEENDLLFRIIDAGYRVATCSGSVVRHPVLIPDASPVVFLAVAASTFITAMLAIEHPRYLPELVRYLWGAARRKPLPWRKRPRRLFNNRVRPWTMVAALASGPFIYLLASLRYRLGGTPDLAADSKKGQESAAQPR